MASYSESQNTGEQIFSWLCTNNNCKSRLTVPSSYVIIISVKLQHAHEADKHLVQKQQQRTE